MKELTVKKPGKNQGRKFRSCDGCDHFEWVGGASAAPQAAPAAGKVDSAVWEKKDRWQAKMSAWKSASTVYEGTGEVDKTRDLAKTIFESITMSSVKPEPAVEEAPPPPPETTVSANSDDEINIEDLPF